MHKPVLWKVSVGSESADSGRMVGKQEAAARSDLLELLPHSPFWGVGNVKLRLGRLPEGEFILVETSTLIPVCSSTRSLKFRRFRGSYERRCSLTKPPRLPLVVSTNGASAWFG